MAKKKSKTGPIEIRTEFTDAEIAAKLAAGLTKIQAIEALQNQAAHDATDPHDESDENPVE